MADEKKKRGQAAKPKVESEQVSFTLEPDLAVALKAYRDSCEFPPSKAEIGIKALKEFLAARGFPA